MQSTNSNPNDNVEPLPDSDSGEFGTVEKIAKKDIKPVNDPLCKHEFVEDPRDQTDYYIAMMCTKCPLGYLKPKNPQKV